MDKQKAVKGAAAFVVARKLVRGVFWLGAAVAVGRLLTGRGRTA